MDIFAPSPGALTTPASHGGATKAKASAPWCVLLVDDDPEVHEVTRLALRKFEFQQRGLELLSVHSATAAQAVFQQRPDLAAAVIDVVMETEHAGLELVRWLRASGLCPLTRLVLRTGQAGLAPEEQVIREFDIDAYREKTELTSVKLRSVLYSALRNHRVLSEQQIEVNRLIGWMTEVLPALRHSANAMEAEQRLRAHLWQFFQGQQLPAQWWQTSVSPPHNDARGPEQASHHHPPLHPHLHACLQAAAAAWPEALPSPQANRLN